MRTLRILVLGSLLACNRGESDEPLRRADGSMLSSSGGEVALADGSHLKFVITSERYKQWEAARGALRRNVAARFGTLLKPKNPTEQSIERAVAFLETDVDARESIERTGMSVRDFVLMTVALEQEMRVASARGSAAPLPRGDIAPGDSISPAPMPAATPMATPMPDTPYATNPVQPSRVPPIPLDSARRPPARDTLTPRRDTLVPTRDTLAPKRDTVRDTTALPPDPATRT